MSHIILSPCVGTCDTACVAVCPVNCIHGPIDVEGAGEEVFNMSKEELSDKQLYINPDECINCCLLYTSPSPRDVEESRMPSSA